MRYGKFMFVTLAVTHALNIMTGSMDLRAEVLAQATKVGEQRKGQDETYEFLKIYTEVFSYLEANHVDGINLKDAIYGSIRGLIKSVDPEGSFISPDLNREMRGEAKEGLAGVGLEITIRDNNLTVVSPIEDTPAFRAGIQPEDQIVKIDGKSTEDMTLVEAVRRLQGPEGTPVTLSIFRKGFTELEDLTLTRAFVTIRSVEWKKLPDNIGYVRLRSFQKTTAEELEDVLAAPEAQNIRALVLDLRNNSGGLFAHRAKKA